MRLPHRAVPAIPAPYVVESTLGKVLLRHLAVATSEYLFPHCSLQTYVVNLHY